MSETSPNPFSKKEKNPTILDGVKKKKNITKHGSCLLPCFLIAFFNDSNILCNLCFKEGTFF